MQELIFLAGWVEVGHCVPTCNVFIFVTEKKHNFQKNENNPLLHLKGKINNSHGYFIVYCLYCLNTLSKRKIHLFSAMLNVVSLAAIVWFRHTILFGKRAHRITRPNNSCKRDYVYCHSSNRQKIKIICLQLAASKI